MNVMLRPVPVPQLAADFIGRPLQLLIGGAWVDAASGKTFDVCDPATGQQIAKAAEGDAADIDAGARGPEGVRNRPVAEAWWGRSSRGTSR